MSYFFKINDHDYSMYVNKLQVGTEHNYKTRTSASGREVINYINSKTVLDVGFIPLNDAAMARLLTDMNKFEVSISYRDPITNTLIENLSCIIPTHLIEYYTIQVGKVQYKTFSIQVIEHKL